MKTILTEMPGMQRYLKGLHTLDIGYPWLAPGAIVAIEWLLRPEHRVLELGAGGSTLFWARRCTAVKSFETDSKWAQRVNEKLLGFRNVQIVCGDEGHLNHRIRREKDESFDWLLADSGPSLRTRFRLMHKAIPKLKKGGYLIIDNYAARYMQRFDYTGWEFYTFDTLPSYNGRGTRICIKQ